MKVTVIIEKLDQTGPPLLRSDINEVFNLYYLETIEFNFASIFFLTIFKLELQYNYNNEPMFTQPVIFLFSRIRKLAKKDLLRHNIFYNYFTRTKLYAPAI